MKYFIFLIISLIVFTGCSVNEKYMARSYDEFWKNEPQIEVGRKNLIVDTVGNITGIPAKIILGSSKVENHNISEETLETIKSYVQKNKEDVKSTKIRINQFAPVGEFKRLVSNKKMKWWWRATLGVPTTLFSLTGRLFGGDHYNPYTDTVNIYSDLPSVALHEAGHAADFTEQSKDGRGGVYAAGRILTPVVLYQEYAASDHAIEHAREHQDRDTEKESYRTLYPAYGTYVGGATQLPYASVVGAGVGHVLGVTPRRNRERAFEVFDRAVWSDEIVTTETLNENVHFPQDESNQGDSDPARGGTGVTQ